MFNYPYGLLYLVLDIVCLVASLVLAALLIKYNQYLPRHISIGLVVFSVVGLLVGFIATYGWVYRKK